MYSAKIVTNAGKTVLLGYEHGILFDIYPLSGTDISISTSQGFQQIGTTVEGQSIVGLRRTIRGNILTVEAAKRLLSFLPPFTTGRLFFNDEYFCNITIQKTPEITITKTGKMPFTMQVYCDVPFWYSAKESFYLFNMYQKAFSFPVTYDSHVFGVKETEGHINAKNTGDVSAPLKCIFTTDSEINNYGIADVQTLRKIQFDDTLLPGEQMTLYQESGKVRAVKRKKDGTLESGLGYISYDSALFDLPVGDNILTLIAAENESVSPLHAQLSFYPAYVGVLP